MPAERGRSLRPSKLYSENASTDNVDFAFAPNVTATTFESSPPAMALEPSSPDSDLFDFEQELSEPSRRAPHGRKKPVNHIPRPPNAFILFRSSFIKSRHVSTGVETNHSTLSKIIGLTWQSLPNEEREKWHAKAKLAHDEHKRRFPQYSFRPIHNKAKGAAAEKKKAREVGPKDQKRCAKIAELLVGGKKGQELEEAIQEFDKHHVPEIVTRFETPITANSFSSPVPSSVDSSSSRASSRKPSSSSSRSSIASYPSSQSLDASLAFPSHVQPEPVRHSPITHFESPLFLPDNSSRFDYDAFAFSVDQPPQTLPGGNFTQAVNPIIPSFNSASSQDLSRLCGHPQYTTMDQWARHGSPMSNSTGSMPSTPAQICIPFPEPYPTFTSEPASDYSPVDLSYGQDYSQYSYAPMPEPTYHKDMGHPASGFGLFRPELVDAPMSREDADFSSFMQSMNSYSL